MPVITGGPRASAYLTGTIPVDGVVCLNLFNRMAELNNWDAAGPNRLLMVSNEHAALSLQFSALTTREVI